jgi:hypothetical protein
MEKSGNYRNSGVQGKNVLEKMWKTEHSRVIRSHAPELNRISINRETDSPAEGFFFSTIDHRDAGVFQVFFNLLKSFTYTDENKYQKTTAYVP